MEWTPDQDLQLTDMYRKRLSVRFIADWMRWPAAAVRARLIELGLTLPLSSRATSVVSRANQPAGPAASRHSQADAAEDPDEDDELRASPGCPRGHLLPEAKIAALYSAVGQNYR